MKLLLEVFYEVAEPEFDKKARQPGAVAVMSSTLFAWNTFSDPVNDQLLQTILGALKTTSAVSCPSMILNTMKRSAHNTEMMIYWLSFGIHLHKSLTKEVSQYKEISFFRKLGDAIFSIYSLLLNSIYYVRDQALKLMV